MIDPLSAEAIRLVGNRASLKTARSICLDLGAHGPSSAASITRRLGRTNAVHIARLAGRMVRVGWLIEDHGRYDVVDMPDPFPRGL